MEIDLIFKIAGIGIIVSILNQMLARSDKGEYVMITTLAGIIIVFIMLIPYIEEFFEMVRDIADFFLPGRQVLENIHAVGINLSVLRL